MEKIKVISLMLIMILLCLNACQEEEFKPNSAEMQLEKSVPNGYSNNPVEQFTASNMTNFELPPPFPIFVPLGNKMKIFTTMNTIVASANTHVNGLMVTKLEGLWDENMTGPVSGEFTIVVSDNSSWQGQVHGKRHKVNESTWVWTGQFIGKGYGTSIEGMKIQFKEEIETYEPMPVVLGSSIEGKIITQ